MRALQKKHPRRLLAFLESLESRLLLTGIAFDAGIKFKSPAPAFYDYNNDSIVDQVFANTVAYGLGGGAFGPLVSITPPSANPTPDLNGDGFIDYVVLGSPFKIVLSSSATAFNAPNTYSAGVNSAVATFGDLNNDGALDMLVYDSFEANTRTFINNGDGTFQSPHTFAVGFGSPGKLTVGDFDGDHLGDYVTLEGFARGNGDGTFQPITLFPNTPGSAAQNPSVVDFNNDGRDDVLITNKIYFGTAGPAQILTLHQTLIAATYPYVAADFTGDGKPDIAIASDLAVGIFVNNGAGNFSSGNTDYSFRHGAQFPSTITPVDYNDDGTLDLLLSESGNNPFATIFIGKGNGDFKAAYEYSMLTSPDDLFVAADFNRDGRADVAAVNITGYTITLSSPTATFSVGTTYQLSNTPDAIATGDVNGDGIPDLAFAYTALKSFDILLGLGNGTFAAPVTINLAISPTDIQLVDFNNDNRADVFLLDTDNDMALFLNDTQNLFPNGKLVSLNTALYPVTGDFNGDGKRDVALYTGNNTISIYHGNGAGDFGTITNLSINNAIQSLVAGDFNKDGITDLAYSLNDTTANPAVTSLWVYLGQANGSLSLRTILSTGVGVANLVAGDLNNDGILDIAGTSTSVGVVLFRGTDGGLFDAPAYFSALHQNKQIAIADFNGDSKRDLLVEYSGLLTFITNSTTPSATTTAVALNQGAINYGDSASFTAHVTAANGQPVAGTVQFYIDTVKFGAPVAVTGGIAVSPVTSTLSAGKHTIRATFKPASIEFLTSTDTEIQNVNKGTLLISANDAARQYASPNPIFSGSISGFVGTDSFTLTFKTAAVLGSHPGDYVITPAVKDHGGKLKNYNVVVVDTGALTISKANQSIVWPTPADIFQGDPLTTKQLNAKGAHPAGGSASGALIYDYPLGEILPLGDTLVTVTAAATQDYNEATTTVNIHVRAPGPDLKVTLGNFKPNYTLVPGETIKIPVTLQNIGNQKVDASKLIPIQILLRQSATNVYDAADPLLLAPILITAPMKPSAKKVFTASIKLPLNFDPATFFITAGLIDPNVGSDPNTNNNEAAAAAAITVARQFGNIPGRKPLAVFSGVDAGTPFKIALTGPGTGTFNIYPNPADPLSNLYDISLTGTTSKTKVVITTTKVKPLVGKGWIEIRNITTDSPLGSFTAPTTALIGAPSDFATFTAGDIGSLSLNMIWMADMNFAGRIGTFTVAKNILEASVNAVSIGTAKITGSINGVQMNLTQPLGITKALTSLSAADITDSELRSVGDVGTIKAKTLDHASIFLGVLDSVSSLPASAADFIPATTATLASLTATTFTNSLVAAYKVTATKLTTVTDIDAALSPFGFATLLSPKAYKGPASTGDFISPTDAVL